MAHLIYTSYLFVLFQELLGPTLPLVLCLVGGPWVCALLALLLHFVLLPLLLFCCRCCCQWCMRRPR